MELPDFTITAAIERQAIRIVETLDEMHKSGVTDRVLRIRKLNRIRSVHSSAAIEANSLTLEQVTDVVNGKRVLGDPSEILEIKNLYAAYNAIGTYSPFVVADFLEAHRLVSDRLIEQPGQFRSMQVGVYQGMRLIHAGAPPAEVPGLMDQIFEWGLLSNLHPLIKSSIMHYAIEYVHPFEDGNGRMGRLWQTVILANWRDVLQWIPVETVVHHNQMGYYEALRTSEQTGDAGIFAQFMLRAIHSTLFGLIESRETRRGEDLGASETIPVITLSDGVNDGVNDGANVRLDATDNAILATLARDGTLTASALAAATGKSLRTIERRLAKLVRAGLLVRRGPAKTGVWIVEEPQQ